MKNTGFRAALSALVLGAGLSACDAPMASPPPGPSPELGPGIHPVLVVESQRDGRAVLQLHFERVDVAADIASLQGELRYDAQRMTLEEATFRPGLAGAWHQGEPGRIRFAAATLDGLGEAPALTLTFAAAAGVRATDFAVAMEELVARETFAPLTAQVVPYEHPRLEERP